MLFSIEAAFECIPKRPISGDCGVQVINITSPECVLHHAFLDNSVTMAGSIILLKVPIIPLGVHDCNEWLNLAAMLRCALALRHRSIAIKKTHCIPIECPWNHYTSPTGLYSCNHASPHFCLRHLCHSIGPFIATNGYILLFGRIHSALEGAPQWANQQRQIQWGVQ